MSLVYTNNIHILTIGDTQRTEITWTESGYAANGLKSMRLCVLFNGHTASSERRRIQCA